LTRKDRLGDLLVHRSGVRVPFPTVRTKLAELTKGVEGESSVEAIRQRVRETYKDEVKPAIGELKESLTGSKLKWSADSFVEMSLLSVGAGSALVNFGLSIPQALLAGGGISLAASADPIQLCPARGTSQECVLLRVGRRAAVWCLKALERLLLNLGPAPVRSESKHMRQPRPAAAQAMLSATPSRDAPYGLRPEIGEDRSLNAARTGDNRPRDGYNFGYSRKAKGPIISDRTSLTALESMVRRGGLVLPWATENKQVKTPEVLKEPHQSHGS